MAIGSSDFYGFAIKFEGKGWIHPGRGMLFKDTAGMKLLDEVGVDNVLFETDYPHSDGTFPRSKEVAYELFGHLDPEVVHKIARGNAIRLFTLPFE